MDDLISRTQAIDALNEYFARIGKLKRRGLTKGEKAISLDTVGAIKTLPSAQQVRTQMSSADDLISRQAAIDLWEKYHPTIAVDAMQYDAELRQLPSAQPELETVKCIIGGGCMDIGDADFSMKCAKCGAEYYHVEGYNYDYNFCPNCGRRWR